jgi:transcriptional regulator with XRE-family HTH domain
MAHRLVNHRKALGMTQKEFARQMGVDPSILARGKEMFSRLQSVFS